MKLHLSEIRTFKASDDDMTKVYQGVHDKMIQAKRQGGYFSVSRLKELFITFLEQEVEDFKVELGDVFHAYGIGNNKRYPVYLQNEKGDRVEFGFLSIVNDMYGGECVRFLDSEKVNLFKELKFRSGS